MREVGTVSLPPMTTPAPTPPLLLRALQGETLDRPPVWFMRQAGRYLPEYRALRAQAPDFIAFCLNPDMAAEATLQPMRRFGFDAAIIFADILLIPRALGQEVWFEAGEGPRLGRMPEPDQMASLAASAGEHLSAVGGSLSRVRAALEPERALIGFCGAPWTVATYMLDGEARTIGKGERAQARTYAYADPRRVAATLEVLVEASAHYLTMQADAGAQVLKIFESWAEGLPDDLFETLVLRGTLAEEGLERPRELLERKVLPVYLCNRRWFAAKDQGIDAVVFDRGGNKYHGRIAALADAAREGGLTF